MSTELKIVESQEIESIQGLETFVNNCLGSGASASCRIILPDGIIASVAEVQIRTLSDGSEIFEVELS